MAKSRTTSSKSLTVSLGLTFNKGTRQPGFRKLSELTCAQSGYLVVSKCTTKSTSRYVLVSLVSTCSYREHNLLEYREHNLVTKSTTFAIKPLVSLSLRLFMPAVRLY